MPWSRKTNEGWTLIEVLLALTVLATLGLTGVPAMQRFVEQHRVVAASNMLVAHLSFARNEAITRSTFVSACPSVDLAQCSGNRWDQGWIVFVDADRVGQPASADDILRVVHGDDRLLMHSGGRFRVRFQPMGGAYGTNLTIRVCGRSGLATPSAVVVSNPGRPRVEREAAGLDCL
ncbi:MAG: pilus assembly protein [Wenzhouxiangella sp.]|nr:MAG: pilus assembly protein [Wenzhouxiangella sp.]